MGLGPAGFDQRDEAVLVSRLLTRPAADISQTAHTPTVLAKQAVWAMIEETSASPEVDRADPPSRPG
eukprot:14002867-Alexandrium_andersonii.AAC.1